MALCWPVPLLYLLCVIFWLNGYEQSVTFFLEILNEPPMHVLCIAGIHVLCRHKYINIKYIKLKTY